MLHREPVCRLGVVRGEGLLALVGHVFDVHGAGRPRHLVLVHRDEMLGVARHDLTAVDHHGCALRPAGERRLRGDVPEEGAVGGIAVAERRHGHSTPASQHHVAHVLHLPLAVRHGVDDPRGDASARRLHPYPAEPALRQAERLRRRAHEQLRARGDDVVLDPRLLEGAHHPQRRGEVPFAIDLLALLLAEGVKLVLRHTGVDLRVVWPGEPAADLPHAGIVPLRIAPPAVLLRIDRAEPGLYRALHKPLEALLAALLQAFADVALDDRPVKVPERHRNCVRVGRLYLRGIVEHPCDYPVRMALGAMSGTNGKRHYCGH